MSTTRESQLRLTLRELCAINAALSRCLAGEPETEEESPDDQITAQEKIWAEIVRRQGGRPIKEA